jgi:hypothetical protein
MDNLIEYILIALLIIIIFQLLFGSSKCKSEHMNIVEKSNDCKNNIEGVQSLQGGHLSEKKTYETPSELLSMESSNQESDESYEESSSHYSSKGNEDSEHSDKMTEVMYEPPEEKTDNSDSMDLASAEELNQDILASDIVETGKSGAKPHFNKGGCMIEQTSINMDRYIKNMLMRELPHCGSEGSLSEESNMVGEGPNHPINAGPNSSKSEIEGYHVGQLDFYDKVNGSSKNGPDMVDKINEFTMGSGKDCGVKIKDVFDKMTTGDTARCIKQSDYDRINALPMYKTNVAIGNMYSDDMWRYKDEKVSNGGKFYGDIEPFNDSDSGHMIY